MVIVVAFSYAGFFPIHSAFPALAPGRHPHCTFRGLLKLYTHYARQIVRPPFVDFVARFDHHGYPLQPLASYRIYHQLFEWVLPPLVISPFWAHAEACTTLAHINGRI